MGISGLLPLLKSIHKHCTLKKFAGQTIGIDAYGWLHRGTVACAIELALDKPTTKYVDFAMGRVRMLLDFGVTPYLVFDGDNLPNKAGTNRERRKRRDESKAVGLELYRAGKLSQAHQELQKAADVTPYMARELIDALKKLNIQYIVAPFEADAQLVFLEEKGIIDGILSEDSDMLVFGAKRLITKLNQYGECVEIERGDFPLCKEVSLTGWTDAMFRRMAILSGCDYLPNIEKMGLKTAYRYIRKYKEADKSIKMVQFEGKLSVPADYLVRFQQAELTFLHHRVYCPIQQKMVFLHELPRGLKEEDMLYLGGHVDAETATGVACGDLDPKTKEPMLLRKSAKPPLGELRRQASASAADLKPKKSIDSFFKAYRQPLAELDPNSLTPSPSQQGLQAQYQNASWAPRLVSSAPQLRRSASVLPTPSIRTDRGAFLARASAVSTFQPPKRPRLCSENQDPSPSKEVKQSPFFASNLPTPSPLVQKKARNKKARRSDFDIWSDDSVDDVLLGLPDIQQSASPSKDDDTAALAKHDEADTTTARSVPQSSPTKEIWSPSPLAAENDLPEDLESQRDQDVAPFEDLLESHIRMQRQSLLKSFVYQSPSRRNDALRSLSPLKQTSSHPNTFAVQSPERQLAALSSLPVLGSVSAVCLVISGDVDESREIDRAQQSLQEPTVPMSPSLSLRSGKTTAHQSQGVRKDRSQSRVTETDIHYPVIRHMGSEDALIPNSEDDNSEADAQSPRPALDLKAFAYVPA
jgi:exonuclease 1